MQQLSRLVRQIDPIVQHGIQEIQNGAPVEHALREVALIGALVGSGVPVNQAIQAVEQVESQLLQMGPWERAETQYHPGYTQQGYVQPGYGQTGYAAPYGKGAAPMGMGGMYGKQAPMGMGGMYGKQAPMGMGGMYGKSMGR